MNDRTLPITERILSEEELTRVRKDILRDMFRGEENRVVNGFRTWRRCLFYAPKLGRYLYNDEFVRPQVAEALIDNDLSFEGFIPHQGEIMVCYRLTDRFYIEKSLQYKDWYGSKI